VRASPLYERRVVSLDGLGCRASGQALGGRSRTSGLLVPIATSDYRVRPRCSR
jgi:hypothetical protein